MFPSAAKRVAHLVGSGLAISGLVFLAGRLRQAGQGVDLRQLGPTQWLLLLGLTVLYGLANRLLAQAWFLILRSLRAEIGAGLLHACMPALRSAKIYRETSFSLPVVRRLGWQQECPAASCCAPQALNWG